MRLNLNILFFITNSRDFNFKEETEISGNNLYRLFLAKSLENAQTYAIKQFFFQSSQTIESFEYLIQAYSKLHDETIVPFVGFCTEEQTEEPSYSIVTKFIEGPSLDHLFELIEQDQIPPYWNSTRCVILLYGISFGLNYLHRNKIVHQNINLSNILLNDKGYPKISDFLIPELIPINIKDYPKSKLIFLAPEVIGTNKFTEKSDIYSFGILSLMILTSDTNIVEQDILPHELIDRIKHGIFTILPDNVPTFLHDLINSCISIDPSQRPKASEIVEKINGFIPEFESQLKIDKEEFENYRDLLTGAEDSFEEKVKIAKANADKGDKQAMHQYARFRLYGDGCKKSKEEAITYFKKAAMNGHQEAKVYLHNLGVHFDPAEKPISETKLKFKGKMLKTDFREKLRQLNDNRVQIDVVGEERQLRMKRNADDMKIKKSETLGIEYRRLADDPFFDNTQAPDMDAVIQKVEEELDNPNYKLSTDFDDIKSDIEKTFNFIFTKGAEERLCKLREYMKCGVPVLLEGPTGTSKTLSVEIVCKLLNRDLIRFNLSSETKTKDLVGRFVGDVNSWAGLRQQDGPFSTAFKEGKVLLLDEINLAPPSVLQCIEESLDSGVFSVEIPGRPLQPITKNKDFVLVATQNPNKGAFANKRQDLGLKFSSHFQIINFPAFSDTELQTIAEGLGKRFGYDNPEVIRDLVKFHSTWSQNPLIQDDPQCFTIREIAAAVHAFSQKKNIYDTVMTIYGARYETKLKNDLIQELKKYKSLCVKPDSTPLPTFSEFLFVNESLKSTVKSILFSLRSGRHVILTGKEGCGKTQVALWISDYYNQCIIPKLIKDPEPTEQIDDQDNLDDFYCICTEDTKVADLVGKQSPASTAKAGDELIVFEQGFLTKAIKRGKCSVLESIDEAPATVTERLNGLLDQKYDKEDKYFDIPEDPKNPKVLIKSTFRILSTCNIDKIGLISPAFLNRFDIIVLENQLPESKSPEFAELVNKLIDKYLKEEQEKAEIKDILKEDDNTSETQFLIPYTLRQKAITRLEERHKWNNISKISAFCKALTIYYLFFPKTGAISEELLLEFTLNMMSSHTIDNDTKGNNRIAPLNPTDDKIGIKMDYTPIIDYLLRQLKDLKQNPEYKDDKFFYENSPMLKYFMAKLMAYSLINQPVCVTGPTGVGKTSSARAFASMRPNSRGNASTFKMHSFHAGTKTSQFFGTTILANGKIDFYDGTLTTALKKGDVFIADEFNLSPQVVMKSIAPALEPSLGRKVFIPGIGQAITINSEFFFIACQNDLGTLGRNAIPESIAHKFAYISYPSPSLEDMQDICVSISREGYDDPSSYPPQDEAEKLATYMNKLNTEAQKNPYITPWSLRDIAKIFRRIKYQNSPENFDMFIDLDMHINVFFYTMASVPQSYRANVIDKVKTILQESFTITTGEVEGVYATYTSEPTLDNINNKYYIRKHLSKVSINEIFLKLTMNSEDDCHDEQLFSKLKTLWNTAFQIMLSDIREPILLMGESGYKTFISQLFLENSSTITLNQETTISQLLGSSGFFAASEAKMFYLKTLCSICDSDAEYTTLLDNWKMGNLTLETIQPIAIKGKRKCPASFYYAIDHLVDKLFQPTQDQESVLANTTLEFRPGLFLSAILQMKSLILKDLSNLPTIVLERFNELFSGKQNLTLTEDIHNTFTESNQKELTDFNTSFRVFGTCPSNTTSKLSEAVLSRFTVIATPKYSDRESVIVLESLCKTAHLQLNSDTNDIKKLIKVANAYIEKTKEAGTPKDISFPIMIKIVQTASRLNELSKEKRYDFHLAASIFRIVGGYENEYSKKILFDVIAEQIDKNFPELYKTNDNNEKSPLEFYSESTEVGIISVYSKLFIHSTSASKFESPDIAFTPLFCDLLDVIHFSMKLSVPLIFEGSPGQGKHTAINYFAKLMGMHVITISISPATKVDDLLGKVKIERREGEIHVEMIKTDLANALDAAGGASNKLRDENIFVIESINNATPAVLSLLVSIFRADIDSLLLPNGETIIKADNVHLIGIFDTSDGSTTRDKLPPSLYYASIYHVVRNPNEEEITDVINNAFMAYELNSEATEFYRRFHAAQKHLENYPHIGAIFTLNDISKYILFRQATRALLPNPITISHIIFVYRFIQPEIIEEMRTIVTNNTSDSTKAIKLRPSFNYDSSYSKLFVQVSPDAKDQGLAIPLLDVDENKNDDYIEALSRIDSLTLTQKLCLIFLACSLLSKRACVIQGDTASGKSFMVRLFADLLGAKLNVFQMNSDSALSMLAGQSVLSDTLSPEDEMVFQSIIDDIATIEELHTYIYLTKKDEFDDKKKWSPQLFTDLLTKVGETTIPPEKDEMIYKATKQLKEIMNPVHRFKHQTSQFINAMEKGEWVLIDGIESAPSEIAVKLTSLCGEKPELNLFEYGPDFMFSRDNGKINENFHLFITFNPLAIKEGTSFDQSFLTKCVSFTLEEVDYKTENSAQILLGSLLSQSYDMDTAIELASRLGNLHTQAKIESKNNPRDFAGELQFTGRTLKFISKAFRLQQMNDAEANTNIAAPIAFSLRNFYLNSISDEGDPIKFKKCLIKYLKYENQSNDDIAQDHLKQELLLNVNNSNQKHRNQIVLTDLRNIQLCVLDRPKKGAFSLSRFIVQCRSIQISDISFILKHIEETIDLIHQNNEEGAKKYMSQFGILLAVRDIFRQISKVNLSIEHSCLQLHDPDLRNEPGLITPLSQFLLLVSLSTNKSINLTNRKSFRISTTFSNLSLSPTQVSTNYLSDRSSFILDSIVRCELIHSIAHVAESRQCEAVFELLETAIRHPDDATFVDSVFPYNLFQNTELKCFCLIVRLLMKCTARRVCFTASYRLSKKNVLTCEYAPETKEKELEIFLFFDQDSKLTVAPDSYFLYSKKHKKVRLHSIPIPFERTHYLYLVLSYLLDPEKFTPPIHFTKGAMEPILNRFKKLTITNTRAKQGSNENTLTHILPPEFMTYTKFSDLFDDPSEDVEPIAYAWNLVITLNEEQFQSVKSIVNPLLSEMLVSLKENYLKCDFKLITDVTNFTTWLVEFFDKITLLFELKADINTLISTDQLTLDKTIAIIRSELQFLQSLKVKVLEWDCCAYESTLNAFEDYVTSKYEKEKQEQMQNDKKLQAIIEEIKRMRIGDNRNLKDDLITEINGLPRTDQSVIYATRKKRALEKAFNKLSFDIQHNIIVWPSIRIKNFESNTDINIMQALYEYSKVHSILRTLEEAEREKFENPDYKEDIYEQTRMNALIRLNCYKDMDGALASLFKKDKKGKDKEKKYNSFKRHMKDAYHELNANFLYQLMEIDEMTKKNFPKTSGKHETWKDSDDIETVKKLPYSKYFLSYWKVIDLFNSRISREMITDNEINHFFELTKTTSEKFEFEIPEISPCDFVYLYVKKNGTKKGPITKNASPNPILQNSLKRLIDARHDTFSRTAVAMAHCIAISIGFPDFTSSDPKQVRNHFRTNFNLIDRETEELRKLRSDAKIPDSDDQSLNISPYIKSILLILKAAGKYDKFYHTSEYTDLSFRFDDMQFLTQPNWLADQVFLNQIGEQYPSFLFWICKNIQVIIHIRKNFKYFQKNLEKSQKDGGNIPQKRLPFWIHCLRLFSAQNCIQFNVISSSANFAIINTALREKILDTIRHDKRSGSNMLGIGWINVMLPQLPPVIANSKLHSVHNFLKNLCIDDHASPDLFVSNVNIKEKAFKSAIESIFQYVIDGKIGDVFNDDINHADETSLVHFFDNPENYIYHEMSTALEDQYYSFQSLKEVNDLKASFSCIYNDYDRLYDAIQADKKVIYNHKRKSEQDSFKRNVSNNISAYKYALDQYKRLYNYVEKFNFSDLSRVQKYANTTAMTNVTQLDMYKQKVESFHYPFKTTKSITFHCIKYTYLRNAIYIDCNKKPLLVPMPPPYSYRTGVYVILPLDMHVNSLNEINFFTDHELKSRITDINNFNYFSGTVSYVKHIFYPLDEKVDLRKLVENDLMKTYKAFDLNSITVYFESAGTQILDSDILNAIQNIHQLGQQFETDFILPIGQKNVEDPFQYLNKIEKFTSNVANIAKVKTYIRTNCILSNTTNEISTIRNHYTAISSYIKKVKQSFIPLYENSKKYKSLINRAPTDSQAIGYSSIFKHNYIIQRPQIKSDHHSVASVLFTIKNGNSLALPVISQSEENKLRASVNSINCVIGPIIPSLYSQKAIITILSMVNQQLECKLEIKEKKDCFLIDSTVPNQQPININVSIPLTRKEKVDDLFVDGKITISTDAHQFIKLPIKTHFILVPLRIKIACERYKLHYIDSKIRICCNEIFSNDHITIKILNYFHSKLLKMKYAYSLQPEDDNEAPQPTITLDNDNHNIITIKMDNITQPKRLHCNLLIAFSRNLMTALALDTEIYPFRFFFQMYDYGKKEYISQALTPIFSIICQPGTEQTLYFRVMCPCLPRSVFARFFYLLPPGVQIINVIGLNNPLINLARLNLLRNKKKAAAQSAVPVADQSSMITINEINELDAMDKCIMEITNNFTFSVTLRFAPNFKIPDKAGSYRFSMKIALDKAALLGRNQEKQEIFIRFIYPPIFLSDRILLTANPAFNDNNIPAYIFDHKTRKFVLYRSGMELKAFTPDNQPLIYATPFESGSISQDSQSINYNRKEITVKSNESMTPYFIKLCTNGSLTIETSSNATKYTETITKAPTNNLLGQFKNAVGHIINQVKETIYTNYYYSICGYIYQNQSIWFPAFSKYPNIPSTNLKPVPENITYAQNNLATSLNQLMKIEQLPPTDITLQQLANGTSPIPPNNFAIFILMMKEDAIFQNAQQFVDLLPYEVRSASKIQNLIPPSGTPDRLMIIYKHNFIYQIARVFLNRFNELRRSSFSLSPKIPNNEITAQQSQARSSYYFYSSNYNNFIKPETRNTDGLYNISQEVNKIKNSLTVVPLPAADLQHECYLLVQGSPPEPSKFHAIQSELQEDTNHEQITADSLNIKDWGIDQLPSLTIPKVLSISSLMEFYNNCSQGASILPIYFRSMQSDKNGTYEAIKYLQKLYDVYSPLSAFKMDYSVISEPVNNFVSAFKETVHRMTKAGMDLSEVIDAHTLKIIENSNLTSEFLKLPEPDLPTLPSYKWLIKDTKSTTDLTFKRTAFHALQGVGADQDYKPSNVVLPMSDSSDDNEGNAQSSDEEEDLAKPLGEVKLVQVIDSASESDDDEKADKESKENKPTSQIGDPKQLKNIKASGKALDELLNNLSEKDEIERIILKIKNINSSDHLKFKDVSSMTEYSILQKPELFQNPSSSNFPIVDFINKSSHLITRIVGKLSDQRNNCPFDLLTVDLIIDASQFIPNANKMFNIILLCGFAYAFDALEIPYSITIAADKEFRFILKTYENHDPQYALQACLDCIFLTRYRTNYADTFHFILEKIKVSEQSKRTQRAMFLFTDGLDENLKLVKSWKDTILKNKNYSFGIIATTPKMLSGASRKIMDKVWSDFNNSRSMAQILLLESNFSDWKVYTKIAEFAAMIVSRKLDIQNIAPDVLKQLNKDMVIPIASVTSFTTLNSQPNTTEPEAIGLEATETADTKPLGTPEINPGNVNDEEGTQAAPAGSRIKDERKETIDAVAIFPNSCDDMDESDYEFIKEYTNEKLKIQKIASIFVQIEKGTKEKKQVPKLIAPNYRGKTSKLIRCSVQENVKEAEEPFIVWLHKNTNKIKAFARPQLEPIFKANKPSQMVLSTTGTDFDITALVLNLLNPVPDPAIYLEEKGGLIRNYAVTIIIDTSNSCFNFISSSHSIFTLFTILAALASIDIPSIDIILARQEEPLVLCSERPSQLALSDKSQVWPALIHYLNHINDDSGSNLEAAMRTAIDLRRMRSSDYTSYLFVLTDGIYQTSRSMVLTDLVQACFQTGTTVIGIGIGISASNITNIFPQAVYASNPDLIIHAIACCFGDENTNQMKNILPLVVDPPVQDDIFSLFQRQKDFEQSPIFADLKKFLKGKPASLDAFTDIYNEEKPPILKSSSTHQDIANIQNPIGPNTQMYVQDLLKGQKILILMLYNCKFNLQESEYVLKDYLFKSTDPSKNACVKSAVEFFGIEIVVVESYKEAIIELTKTDPDHDNKCPYYAVWIISGFDYPLVPVAGDEKYVEVFIKNILVQFWNKGGSVVLFAESDPLTFQTNFFLREIKFPDAEGRYSVPTKLRVGGNHPGEKDLLGVDGPGLPEPSTFSRCPVVFKKSQRVPLSHNLYRIYEGQTISYAIKTDDKGQPQLDENGQLIPADCEEDYYPFIPFMRDSDGGLSGFYYVGNQDPPTTGDIIVDCGFTKLFDKMTEQSTEKYLQNIAGFTAHPEYAKIAGQDPKDYRPYPLNFDFNELKTAHYDKYAKLPPIQALEDQFDFTQLKKLFAVDYSGSVDGNRLYHESLKKIFYDQEFPYDPNKDTIIIWDDKADYVNLDTMIDIWTNQKGRGLTYPQLILKLLHENPPPGGIPEHLIMITDGYIGEEDLDKTDQLYEQFNFHFQYVTVYVIGQTGDRSVISSFFRNCPSTEYRITDLQFFVNSKKITHQTLSSDFTVLSQVDSIKSSQTFLARFDKLSNAVQVKCIGKKAEDTVELRTTLEQLRDRIIKSEGTVSGEFDRKIKALIAMANGEIRHVFDDSRIAAMLK